MPRNKVLNTAQYDEGLRLLFYRSIMQERKLPAADWDFFLWGATNYLFVDGFSRLSEFADREKNGFIENEWGDNQTRFLYLYKDKQLYKDKSTNLDPDNHDRNLRRIFQSDMDYPLLVITLLRADLGAIISKVKTIATKVPFNYDFFKMLGDGTGVLVTRCKAYSDALRCLLALNEFTENTYSIAGTENPFSSVKRPRGLLFPKLLQPTDQAEEISPTCVVINYTLREGNHSKDRTHDTIKKIMELKQKITEKLQLSDKDLGIWTYYEIGRFDLAVRIEGKIVYILEFLLNPHYGLATIQSKFYRDYIFESRTIWKSIAPFND